jgi:hypothetical protein
MGAGSSTVTVFCTACRSEANVRSRTEYGAFDTMHRARCRSHPVLYRASVEDLLDLPTYWTAPGPINVSLVEGESRVRIGHTIG